MCVPYEQKNFIELLGITFARHRIERKKKIIWINYFEFVIGKWAHFRKLVND